MATILDFCGVEGKALADTKSFYEESRACIRAAANASSCFSVNFNLRRVCGMCP